MCYGIRHRHRIVRLAQVGIESATLRAGANLDGLSAQQRVSADSIIRDRPLLGVENRVVKRLRSGQISRSDPTRIFHGIVRPVSALAPHADASVVNVPTGSLPAEVHKRIEPVTDPDRALLGFPDTPPTAPVPTT